MTRIRITVALALLVVACTTGRGGAMDTIGELMEPYRGEVPGASVLVLRDGRPVVREGFGFANLERGVPATPATNYRLASVTKQFTAAAILLLAEDGELSIDDPVRRWLPSLPSAAAEVTIRHLLTHTSGLVDYEDLIPDEQTEQVHDADVLHLLENEDRTYFVPGSSYRYSNSGYALLALIVERVSGRKFADFLETRIFEPLGMDETVAYEKGMSVVPNRAYGYGREKGRWVRNDQSVTSAVLGDGGIYSSIDDLAKWDAALYDDRLLSEASRRLAFTPATETDRPGVGYGFGWRIEDDSVWHTGETRGFRNVILRYPAERVTIVVLTNRNEGSPRDLALQIAQTVRSGKSKR